MVSTLNKSILEDTFNSKYNEEQFKKFISDLLVDANFSKEQMIQPIPNDYKDFIRSAKRLCKYTYSVGEYDETTIDVLVVKLKKVSSIDRARTAQRNFIARYLNGGRNYQKDAALVVFLSEDENGNISDDWRLSLVKMDYVRKPVTDANGNITKVKTEVELTPAKRFSFLVEKNGEKYNTHTVQNRFSVLLEKSTTGTKLTIEDLVQAFDIEKVSKEFFDEYKKLYIKMCVELKRLYDCDSKIRKDFDNHNINIEDFAKKSMGQLVFLYFIQKKGWLGVQREHLWGSGDKNFMRNIFDKKYCDYDNFFNDVLEHLFYEALASDRGTGAWFDKLNCRIPFLNGGLFEPVNGYEYEVTDLTIDNNIFKEIFDTFDLYNFTVKEDEPLEKEVAVDPEMLGKVFENLLPENERKGNGAFYTPREIVHYMCQESLINYLYNKINTKEVPLTKEEKEAQLKLFKKEKKQEQLKFTQEVFEEKISKDDINILIKKGDSTYKNRKVKEELPQSIIDNADILDKALANIKVCDPAIGSGAFPVGMMNEIVRARSVLNPNKPVYELKRNAIENSIYGVDIDPGAVEIAKLRFWLSLVVDEENTKEISPLPNLDYKIMQGNSLITSYEGIDFDKIIDDYKPDTQLTMNLWGDKSKDIKTELSSLLSKFFETSHSTEKKKLKEQIEGKIIELVKNNFEEKAKKEGKPANYYENDIRKFAQNKEKRNFFPWKLFFADTFEQGGFDVVIGNPPYFEYNTENDDHKIQIPILKTTNIYKYAKGGKLQAFKLFIAKAFEINKNNGVNCLIFQNSFLADSSCKNIRKYSLYNNMIIKIDSFPERDNPQTRVFENVKMSVAILFAQKNKIDEDYSFPLNVWADRYMKKLYTTKFKISELLLFDDTTYQIPSLKENEKELLKKVKNIKTINIKCYEGEINMTFHKHFMNTNSSNPPVIKGAGVQRYYITDNMSQGILEYINEFKYLSNNNGIKSKHHLYERIAMQGISGVDDKRRIIATYIKNGSYLANSCNYIINEENSDYDIKYILGLFNSKLFNWIFKKTSTNSNVNCYEVELLPFKLINKVEQNKVVDLVNKIMELSKKQTMENKSKINFYENHLDCLVYKIYNLTYEEVLTIDKDFSLTEQEYLTYTTSTERQLL